MSNRHEITKNLSLSLQKHLNPKNDPRIYWAKEVTFDYFSASMGRVDYMLFKPQNNTISGIEKGDFYCYEVKSSVADFHSKNGHNFIGDFNYYVMPYEVYEDVKKEIPFSIGVYVSSENHNYETISSLVSIKKARRMNRKKPIVELLLMMFRSAAREIRKKQDSK